MKARGTRKIALNGQISVCPRYRRLIRCVSLLFILTMPGRYNTILTRPNKSIMFLLLLRFVVTRTPKGGAIQAQEVALSNGEPDQRPGHPIFTKKALWF